MRRATMAPTYGNGKICYLEIPATDIARSAEFYRKAFGWQVRQRSDGATAFDDGVGEVSGSWVLGRAPASTPGVLIYIMVDNAEESVKKIVSAGGEIVQPIGADAPEITAGSATRAATFSGSIKGRCRQQLSILICLRPRAPSPPPGVRISHLH